MTGLASDYKRNPVIEMPFKAVRAVIAGNHYVGKQIIDAVVFFVKSTNELNSYLDERIDDALRNRPNQSITDTYENESSDAQTALVQSVNMFGTFFQGYTRQRRLTDDDYDLPPDPDEYKEVDVRDLRPLEQRINSALSTGRDSRRESNWSRRNRVLNDELDEYNRHSRRHRPIMYR